MTNYKCIGCGEIKESESSCSCSNCGYLMFEEPYERGDKLKSEILSFVSRLRPLEIEDDHILSYREEKEEGEEKLVRILKVKDDKRFPTIKELRKFICSSSKTEKFHERCLETIENIKRYLSTPYERDYTVSYENLLRIISIYDNVIEEATPKIDVDVKLEEVVFPETKLHYEEFADDTLLQIALDILSSLETLAGKMKTFIKVNNLYGKAYCKEYDLGIKLSKDKNYVADLGNVLTSINKIVSKKYVVDIFEDGSAEIDEMLKTFWTAIETIMLVPILKKKSTYNFDNGTCCLDEAIKTEVASILEARYYPLHSALYLETPLDGKSENELFEIYNQMIEIDHFGLMGVNKNQLLRIGEHEGKLNALIGLAPIKESIKKLKAYVVANKDSGNLNLHMCFYGNPGTGKTEVARIIAGILYENKILPTKKVIEVSRKDLVGEYVGETPGKTEYEIQRAMGGVLFIDEAYSLVPNDAGFDYGNEAIATLIKAMEDYRGKFCVILAGYKNEMLSMLSTNPGFKSRIQFELDFQNYSREELGEITSLMLTERGYNASETAKSKILDITDVKRKEPNFANAREIRNILDQVIMCQNLRAASNEDRDIGLVDVNRYISDAHISLPTSGEGVAAKIMTADEELEELVGLGTVKRMVKKIRAYAKRNKSTEGFNVHMCFHGNPGTGTTEVARILSRILYDAEVLPEAKLLETDAHGLIGKYVGETAPKTEAKINDSLGGVLFIDEAYALTDNTTGNGGVSNYGDEAISVLLKRMEDDRGRFCVILAGYREEMQRMISSNPGLASRIQFTLEFPDYTREELSEILIRFAAKRGYLVDESARERILDITEYFRTQPNFANARTIRNILDQVIMNQNLRTEDEEDNSEIILEDVEDYIADEKITFESSPKRKIGF